MSVYAVSDLHGMLDLYHQIKAFLKPEDKVYCLGDCGDRGYASWELIKAVAADPQFIYMMGNHERMLIDAAVERIKLDMHDEKCHLLWCNGGDATLEGLLADEKRDQWITYLRKLPTYHEYINKNGLTIYLSHAGFSPVFFEDGKMTTPDDYDLLWDRYHFIDPWPVDCENAIIVHGHTPIPNLIKRLNLNSVNWEPGAFWYCKNHKVCIDNGAFATNYCCLLDLDTFDEHIFKCRKEKED